MLRKLPADESVADDLSKQPPVRAVVCGMDTKRPRLVPVEKIPASASLQADFAKVAAHFKDSDPCAVVVRLKDEGTLPAQDGDCVVIVWTPKTMPGPQKSLWSTSGEGITEVCPGRRMKELLASDKSEVTWEKFLAKATEVTGEPRALFYDMKQSNNAARIRLWLALKGGMEDKVETRMMTQPQLKEPAYAKVNPLQKVPALIRKDGKCTYESHPILEYLEDKFSASGPTFKPDTPEDRQLMEFMIRMHDIYVASTNCTAPGFCSSLRAMYMSADWHGATYGMDLSTRAAKLAEIWKQLSWLNSQIVGPYLVGPKVTLADMTWFPTAVYIEFMGPRVFGWPDVLKTGPFPALVKWWAKVSVEPAFAKVRQDIFSHWEEMEKKGQFKPIIQDVAASGSGLKFKYP